MNLWPDRKGRVKGRPLFGRASNIVRTKDPIEGSLMVGIAGWSDAYFTGANDDEQVEAYIRSIVTYDTLMRISAELESFLGKLKTPPTGPEFI